MTRASLLNGLCLVIALAVMFSAVPFLRAAPSSYEVAASHTMDAFVHAGLVDGIGHGHSPEHKDHSNVTLGLASAPASLVAPYGTFLRQWEQGRPSSHLSFHPDRPPCPSFAA